MRIRFVALALLVVASACQPAIGDDCNSSVDCAPNGGRICDLASPGGYCTIQGCDPNGCPESALCVEWLYEQNRTSTTYCMEKCSNSSDCDRNGYRCVREGDPELISAEGESLARVTDFDGRADNGFCAYVAD